DREDGGGRRRGSGDALRPDVRFAVLRVDVHDQEHRIVLGTVADAVYRVLRELDVGRRGRAVRDVVPRRRRIGDDVPARRAAEVDAAVEEDHDPCPALRRVQGWVVEVEMEGRVRRLKFLERLRQLVRGRLREELVLPLDPDDHARLSGARYVGRALEQPAPHPGRALPILEIRHADGGARPRVPPLRGRELRVLNRLADLALELVRRGQELADGESAQARDRADGARGQAELGPFAAGPTLLPFRFLPAQRITSAEPPVEPDLTPPNLLS